MKVADRLSWNILLGAENAVDALCSLLGPALGSSITYMLDYSDATFSNTFGAAVKYENTSSGANVEYRTKPNMYATMTAMLN